MTDDNIADATPLEASDTFLKPGDRLFLENGEWEHTMPVEPDKARWRDYIFGYKKAADILVSHLAEDWSIGSMTLAFPIIFLYRQHVELCLKETIRQGRMLHSRSSEFPKHHNLRDLWDDARALLVKTWPNAGADDLEAIEKCLEEFAAADPSSTRFRYPGSSASSRPALEKVNFAHLSKTIHKLTGLLLGAADQMNEYLGYELETEANSGLD